MARFRLHLNGALRHDSLPITSIPDSGTVVADHTMDRTCGEPRPSILRSIYVSVIFPLPGIRSKQSDQAPCVCLALKTASTSGLGAPILQFRWIFPTVITRVLVYFRNCQREGVRGDSAICRLSMIGNSMFTSFKPCEMCAYSSRAFSSTSDFGPFFEFVERHRDIIARRSSDQFGSPPAVAELALGKATSNFIRKVVSTLSPMPRSATRKAAFARPTERNLCYGLIDLLLEPYGGPRSRLYSFPVRILEVGRFVVELSPGLPARNGMHTEQTCRN